MQRYNVESWWPTGAPVGTGNVASDNCLWNGTQGNVADQVGFTASNNRIVNPGYADRSAGNFALPSGSACAGYGPAGDNQAQSPASASAAPAAARRDRRGRAGRRPASPAPCAPAPG